MAVLACLGRVNLWTTVPFLGLLAVFGIVAACFPRVTRRLPGRRYSVPTTRLMGVAVATVAVVMLVGAVHEARTDPHCEMETSAPTVER